MLRLPNGEGGAASHGKGELEYIKGAYKDATNLKYIRENQPPILYNNLF